MVSDLKVRYKNSVLGFFWTLLNPLLMTVILWAVFVFLFKVDIPNFHVFLLIGLVAWRFFAIGTSTAMLNLVGKANLVKKVYFPREVLVFSSSLYALISSLLEFIAVFAVLVFSGIQLSFPILLFPVVLLLEFVLVYGVSLAISALYVYYRDMSNVWEVVLNAGFYLTPIFYSRDFIPSAYRFVLDFNPLAHLVELFRQVLLYAEFPSVMPVVFSVVFGLLFVVLGWSVFARFEPDFAEKL